MFAPNAVTVYNVCPDGSVRMTFLDGVFLETGQEGSVSKNGVVRDGNALLFIPFDCVAVDAAGGQVQQFCPPGDFDRLDNRNGFWTVGPKNTRSCVDCFFVRGKVVAPDLSFAEIHDRFQDAFRVSSVFTRDFGSRNMRHWQIGGK